VPALFFLGQLNVNFVLALGGIPPFSVGNSPEIFSRENNLCKGALQAVAYGARPDKCRSDLSNQDITSTLI
jgi:hypothetical protein